MASATREVDVDQAKTSLSRLLELVEAGEEIVITRNGKGVARLVQIVSPATGTPRFGTCAGQIWIADDFDAPLPEGFWLGDGE